eukprot:COSAG01_NODE_32228_length_584_cov_1.663918_2_plen_33_part_01
MQWAMGARQSRVLYSQQQRRRRRGATTQEPLAP